MCFQSCPFQGVLIGIFACFICKWRQNRNDKQGFGDSYTGYHSSSNGNNKSANGSVPNGVQKPNNAFDDSGENAPISVKGSNQSTENKDEKPPLLNLNLKTDNETGLLRKPADLQTHQIVQCPSLLTSTLQKALVGLLRHPSPTGSTTSLRTTFNSHQIKTIKWELLQCLKLQTILI